MSIAVTTNETTVQVTATSGPLVSVAVTEVESPILVTALIQGPAGGTSSGFMGTAGEAIGGHRVVAVDPSGLYIYSTGIYGVGLTQGAAASGASVSIQTSGEMEEPSWTWTPGLPVYQAGIGQITQTVPETGFIREIGIATAPNKMSISFKSPIILG